MSRWRPLAPLVPLLALVAACTNDAPDAAASSSVDRATNPSVSSSAGAVTAEAASPTAASPPAAPTTASIPIAATTSTAVTTTEMPTSTTLAAPCQLAASSITIDGRTVLLRTPSSASPVPLVIALPGYKGTLDGLEAVSQLTEIVGPNAFVAYVSGTPLDLGSGWNSGATRFATSGVDDVAILLHVVQALTALACVDPSDVAVVGESNGGGMAVRLACYPRATLLLDLVVLVNPAIDAGVLATCPVPAAVPVRVLATAGRLDGVVGFEGERPPFVPALEWFDQVAMRLAACSQGQVHRSTVSSSVELVSASLCERCAQLYVVGDGPHTWPGSPPELSRATPGSLDFTELIRDAVLGGACA